jgi:ribose-phosphate pyrophosphokinase
MDRIDKKITGKLTIVSGRCSYDVAEKIARSCEIMLGRVSVCQFSDGEIQPRYDDDIKDSDIYIIQSTHSPAENFMELLMLIDAAQRASAKSVTAVIPYFGYSRQNHFDKPGVSFTAQLHARLLAAAGVNRIITFDLDSSQLAGFSDVQIVQLHPTELFCSYIKSLKLDNLTFCAKEIGDKDRVSMYAKKFDTDYAMVHKEKPKFMENQSPIVGYVSGRNVILLDDIVNTAHSICHAAEIIMNHGAASVRAIAAHPVLSGNAYEYIENSGLMEFVVTDTIPLTKTCPKIKVLSTAAIFVEAIKQQERSSNSQ